MYLFHKLLFFVDISMRVKNISKADLQLLYKKYILDLPEKQFALNRIFKHYHDAFYGYHQMYNLKVIRDHKYQLELQTFVHIFNDSLPDSVRMFKSQLDQCLRQCWQTPICGVILRHRYQGKNLYLLVRDRRTGKDGFAKGKMEPDDTSKKAAAIRETMQQTGYKVICPDKKPMKIQLFSKTGASQMNTKKPFYLFDAYLEDPTQFKRKVIFQGDNYHRQITQFEWIEPSQFQNRYMNFVTKEAAKRLGFLGNRNN